MKWSNEYSSPRITTSVVLRIIALLASFALFTSHNFLKNGPTSPCPQLPSEIVSNISLVNDVNSEHYVVSSYSRTIDNNAALSCNVDKLDFPFRTVSIQQSPVIHYKMFLYGPGKDRYISDMAFNSNGTKTFEMHIQALMDQQLKGRVPNDTVILDIGANIGTHALHLASKGFVVHAFEPSVDNFNLLKCSGAANRYDNLLLNNFGLSNDNAELCLKIDNNNHGHAVLGNNGCPEADKVVVKKLDDYVEGTLEEVSPYMIKIDVEGHEMLAFEGGMKMFQSDPPKLIFAEIMWLNKTQFVDFFWSYNYTIYLAKGMKKIEQGPVSVQTFAGQLDAVLVHSSIDIAL